MFPRSNESHSHMEMMSPEVSIHLCGTNREQIFCLPKSSWTMMCAVSLLFPNSSVMNISVSLRSCAPTFHASPLQFSPICSRTWCLHVAPLRCNTTSHTDYVQLAPVGLHCRSHAVRAVSILPMPLKNHAHARTHAPSFVEIWHHSPNFLDTPCRKINKLY